MPESRVRAAEVIGKAIITEENGRKFGVVENVEFVVETGELINLVVGQPSSYVAQLNLKKNEKGKILIPFSAVKSIGDFVIISESELY
ncbi:MAG: PRC-barrel domain-containing protein [Candidatus Aenigmarchaeota archaeon]|nr:PRC-barrel domain-containing protein [Candidatus Aenigmarchaeota archaeon]MDW8149499.1 PRC-barrel domain-containing protein [Candidatus Aenigmarchaeota archaeon]